jgi:hypothetical protein
MFYYSTEYFSNFINIHYYKLYSQQKWGFSHQEVFLVWTSLTYQELLISVVSSRYARLNSQDMPGGFVSPFGLIQVDMLPTARLSALETPLYLLPTAQLTFQFTSFFDVWDG